MAMRERWHRSTLPFYAVGVVCLLYGLLFPLYRWWDFLILAAVAVAAFLITRHFFPGKKILEEIPDPAPATGNADADQLILTGRDMVRQLKEANAAIPDPTLSSRIDRLTELTERIFAHVAEQPRKAPQIRKFMNYYLPTTLKLLRSYDRLDDQTVQGGGISDAMRKIESAVEVIVPAFERQLDALFADEVLDITTDITVLEGMLTREGLAPSDFEQTE